MKNKRNAGFSLLELLIAVSLLGVASGTTLMLTRASKGLASQTQVMAQLDHQLHRALGRMTKGLRSATLSSLTPAAVNGSASLAFQEPEGMSGGAPVLGPIQTYRWESAPDDPLDNVDNNGNGVIDEGRIVFVPDASDPTRRTVISKLLAPWFDGESGDGLDENGNGLIDEPGLSFELRGRVLTLRMTVQTMSAEGVVVSRSRQAQVSLRNP